MSLKAFHLFFIVAATLLSAGLGGWSFSQYSVLAENWLLALGIGAGISTAALVAYLPWFIQRYRSFSYLSLTAVVMALTASPSAQACAVCFGNPNSLLVKSANTGIWALMMIIGAVLLAFICLFGFWWSRARRIQRDEATRLAA